MKGAFKLNSTQRDENQRPRPTMTGDWMPRSPDEEKGLNICKLVGVKPDAPLSIRSYWILREAFRGAVTAEDFRKLGIPDPPNRDRIREIFR